MKRYTSGKVREKSILTGCQVEELFRLPQFPIHTFGKNTFDQDSCMDMVFDIGKEDGFVQLNTIVSSNDLYIDSHMNAIGESWAQMRVCVARLILKYPCKTVLEIGGGRGALFEVYKELGGETDWIIIDPLSASNVDGKLMCVKGFFPEDMPNIDKTDMLVHTHFLEHVEDLWSFLGSVKNYLSEQGLMVFAVPDMEELYSSNAVSIIHFEHTFYLNQQSIEYLLNMNGFSVIEKQKYGKGHSIVYVARYTNDNFNKAYSLNDMYNINKHQMLCWYERCCEYVSRINEQMMDETRVYYLFGAHISSQILISLGLCIRSISGIIDNDVTKKGKRLAGTQLIAQLAVETINSTEKKMCVIVPPSPYKEEIIAGLICINPNVEVI